MTIPVRVGKYPIRELVGKGAMGIVYRGYDPVIKRDVAIKTIRKELTDDDDQTEAMSGRFRREAQAAGTLNHPGIVSVYEYGEDERHAYIAMEFIEGRSLREYLTNGAVFDEHDSVSIMSQAISQQTSVTTRSRVCASAERPKQQIAAMTRSRICVSAEQAKRQITATTRSRPSAWSGS